MCSLVCQLCVCVIVYTHCYSDLNRPILSPTVPHTYLHTYHSGTISNLVAFIGYCLHASLMCYVNNQVIDLGTYCTCMYVY